MFQAQDTYDEAIEAGESAFLMEESSEVGDVFQCQVGNLPPHTDTTICFAYVIEMDIQADKSVRFVMPAILGQRYGGPDKPGDPADTSTGRVGSEFILKVYLVSSSSSSSSS